MKREIRERKKCHLIILAGAILLPVLTVTVGLINNVDVTTWYRILVGNIFYQVASIGLAFVSSRFILIGEE